jgi:hypothetical protein
MIGYSKRKKDCSYHQFDIIHNKWHDAWANEAYTITITVKEYKE